MIDTVQLIVSERTRQERLAQEGKFLRTCASPDMPFDERLAVLAEEVGEAASAYQAFKAGKTHNLPEELIQVAAVCVAWLESVGWTQWDVICRIAERSRHRDGSLAGMVALLGLIVTAPTPEHVVALEDLAVETVSWLRSVSVSLLDA